MKIGVLLRGETRSLDLRREGDRYRGRIDRRDLEAEVIERDPFSFLVRIGSRTFDVTLVEVGPRYLVDLGGSEIELEILDPIPAHAGWESTQVKPGRHEVRAMMPGKVVAVKVEVGDEVKNGQGLLVVEAMKMENEVTSPRSGRIVAVEVASGQTVETGALLVAVE